MGDTGHAVGAPALPTGLPVRGKEDVAKRAHPLAETAGRARRAHMESPVMDKEAEEQRVARHREEPSPQGYLAGLQGPAILQVPGDTDDGPLRPLVQGPRLFVSRRLEQGKVVLRHPHLGKARQAYAHRTEETPGVALGVAARGAAAHHHDHLPASPEGAPVKIVGDHAGDAPAVDRTDQDPPLLRDEGGIVPASHPLPKVGKPVVQRACQHSGDMGAVARSTPIQDHASSKPHLGTKKQAIPMFRPLPFLLE